jgi:uncharacterized protein DUF4386
MSPEAALDERRERSSRTIVRLAAVFYVLTILTGGLAATGRGPMAIVSGSIAGLCYVVVTILFYVIFKPAGAGLSLLAAVVGLAGCAVGPLARTHLLPFDVNPLAVFGIYCLLLGTLVLRSTFLPRFLGVLLVFAACGWLTFLSPALGRRLSPWNFFPGLIGEGALTVWLLVKGVDVPRWLEQARPRGSAETTR